MSTYGDDWPNTKRDLNRAGGFGLKWFIIVVVAVALIGAAGWGIKVATSDIRGRGDVVIQQNDADNRISAQAFFEETYQEIQAADRRVDLMAESLAANPNDRTLQTNLTGTQSYCLSLIADYNAEARKTIRDDWRSPDLPYQIDEFATNTDCKPSI